jgi:hypothetical protein
MKLTRATTATATATVTALEVTCRRYERSTWPVADELESMIREEKPALPATGSCL